MLGRKTKALPEQGRNRQARTGNPAANPAFSYYASKRPAIPETRSSERQSVQTVPVMRRRPKLAISQLPYVLLLLIVGVCLIKLLALNTNPKVVVVGGVQAAASYVQSNDVYASAAHALLAKSIMNRNKITANISGTTKALQQQFPELQTASLTIPLVGNRPVLYVQAAPPSLVLQTTDGNFALNQSGVVLARLQAIPSGVPLLHDQIGRTGPQVSKAYIPGSTVQFIRTLAYQFAAAKLPISAYVLPPSNSYELDMRLTGKPYIVRFNLEADALQQSGAAIATIQQLGATTPTNYLDMRTPERVYYK